MYQAVFFDTDVDESAEIGDIPHDTRQFHTYAQIINRAYILVELEYFDRAARVTSRLFELLQNIFQGGHSDGGGEIPFGLYLQAQFLVGEQFGYAASQIGGHLLYDMVTLRVHRRIVQRVLGIRYAQEAGALLKGLCAHTRNFHQLLAGSECSVLGTIVHDVLSQLGAESRDVCKQMTAGGVQIDADQVYAVLYGLVE